MESLDDLVQQLLELDSDLAVEYDRLQSLREIADVWTMKNHGGGDPTRQDAIEAINEHIDRLKSKRALLDDQIKKVMVTE